MRFIQFPVILGLCIVASISSYSEEIVTIPQIDGDWWTVAGNPNLGAYTADKQQPVDFGVWKAADGTWQLWSCIRHTTCGEKTRLFYRWQGEKLTEADRKPMGIAMEANPNFGETSGGMQAPHVVKRGDRYYLFRTQRYGQNEQTSVYRSPNPLDFGVNDDRYFVCRLPIAAPEIIKHEGEEYIAVLRPDLNGSQIARLKWVEK